MNDEYYISLIGEAFDGYSEVIINSKPAFIKHVSLKDQRYLQKYYEKYKAVALNKGLDSKEERLETVMKDGMWSPEEDAAIASLEFELKNLRKTQQILPLQSQRDEMGREVAGKESQLVSLISKKSEILGKTAEDYATARSGDEILRFLIFKDKDLTQHFFEPEEFDNLEAWEVLKINQIQSLQLEKFVDEEFQKAVLRPFFSMYLSLCEDVYGFYRKPVTHLTVYQLKVVLFGRMFFNVFQNTEDIPDDIRQDPDKLLSFSENQRNKDKRKSGIKDDADVSMVFGATKDDMKSFDRPVGNKELAEAAKEHGGQLNMEQMMRLAGHDV